MPTPGPVANQPHDGSLTSPVISFGSLHVTPSSSLWQSQTVRAPRAACELRADSLSPPRLCVSNSQTLPVFSSTTAHGLPQVFVPSSQRIFCRDQDFPPSVERLQSTSTSPVSARLLLRPSQNATSAPLFVATIEGIRYV